jgi:hypothetical protein
MPFSERIRQSVAYLDERERFTPTAEAVGNCPPLEAVIPADTASCASLGFLVSRYADEARLFVNDGSTADAVFIAQLAPLPVALTPSDLDVQLQRISYRDDTLTVTARLFNPTSQAISLSAQDFALVLGFVPNPTGMASAPNIASAKPTSTSYATALDVVLDFPYNGEGFATLTMVGRVWGVRVR